jgi:hypothetical protein
LLVAIKRTIAEHTAHFERQARYRGTPSEQMKKTGKGNGSGSQGACHNAS